jgi:hypothetical protein
MSHRLKSLFVHCSYLSRPARTPTLSLAILKDPLQRKAYDHYGLRGIALLQQIRKTNNNEIDEDEVEAQLDEIIRSLQESEAGGRIHATCLVSAEHILDKGPPFDFTQPPHVMVVSLGNSMDINDVDFINIGILFFYLTT